jgi:hypothetical protein
MKNWLYIPFLLLMAVTYTRVVENYNSDDTFTNAMMMKRGPASLEAPIVEKRDEDCFDLPSKYNPHYLSRACYL